MDAFNREDLCAQTQTLVLAGGRIVRYIPGVLADLNGAA